MLLYCPARSLWVGDFLFTNKNFHMFLIFLLTKYMGTICLLSFLAPVFEQI